MSGNRNRQAANLVRAYRVDAGLSPEELARQITLNGAGRVAVSGRTIRRIEQTGKVPTVRVQFALASYFGYAPTQFWPLRTRVRVRP